MQSPLKAGLYVCKRIIFLSLNFGGIFCAIYGREKRRNHCTKRVHTMFSSLYYEHCNCRIISIIQEIMRGIVRLRTARQNRILRLSLPLFIISPLEHVQRKAIAQSWFVSISLHYYRSYGQCYIIFQMESFNTQATTQKRTENRCHFRRVIFLCSLERFISKSLQDRKKLQINYTHKCSVWVIVRRTGASSRRNGIRLVVWWCGIRERTAR